MSNKYCYTYDAVARIEEERSHLAAGQRHGKRGAGSIFGKDGKIAANYLGAKVWETFEATEKAMKEDKEEGLAVYKVRADYVRDTQPNPAAYGEHSVVTDYRHLIRWAELVDI